MTSEQIVVAMGVHVVDMLARPVEAIPEGQDGQLVEEIRITPAGSAGGTAVTLAKLGARVRSAGAIGADALGDVMLELLGRYGIDTSLLVRRDGVQTSASVLPIRPDGSRPAFHVIGARVCGCGGGPGHPVNVQLDGSAETNRGPRAARSAWSCCVAGPGTSTAH